MSSSIRDAELNLNETEKNLTLSFSTLDYIENNCVFRVHEIENKVLMNTEHIVELGRLEGRLASRLTSVERRVGDLEGFNP